MAEAAASVLETIQHATAATLAEQAQVATDSEKTGATMYKQYAQEAKAHGRAPDNDDGDKFKKPDTTEHVLQSIQSATSAKLTEEAQTVNDENELPLPEEESGANMKTEYARNAKAHGRSVQDPWI